MELTAVDGIPEWLPEHLAGEGIESLYPPQAEAVEAGVTRGESLVASVPTASGKTLVAELAMLASVAAGGKALYIVPLRALASEKKSEFEQFTPYGVEVGVSTGNYDSNERWLGEKDIVVATSEKVDSLVRNNAQWLSQLDCVVADEVHLVDDPNRGPTLEVTLAKLRRINPNLQVVALSATIGNAEELAEWLDAELVDSEWRPIVLRKGVHYGQALHFDDGSQRELRVKSSERATEAIVRDTLQDDVDEEGEVVEAGGSSLVFVNSRRNAESAAKRLANTTVDHLDGDELARLQEVSEEIRGVSDTETSDDLADCVAKGAAFHHAGLCVTGNTQILRPNGTMEAIEAVVGRSDGSAVGLEGYELREVDITDTFEMGERPVVEVRTRTGNRLKLSRTHPLPTLGEDGIEWIPARDIEAGTYVARPRELRLDSQPPTLRSLIPAEARVYRQYETVGRLADSVDTTELDMEYRTTYARNRNIAVGDFRTLCRAVGEDPDEYLGEVMSLASQRPVSVPREIDQDICWLAGAVAGDGYLRSQTLGLTGKSTGVLEEFERIVERFGLSASRYTTPPGTPQSRVSCKLVCDMLEDHFGIPRNGGERRLPSVELTDELLGAYLSGLFDADGSVSARENADGAPCVEFYTMSEVFATQIKTSLLRFGILAYRDTRDREGTVSQYEGRAITSRSDVERLTIYGVDQLRLFAEKVGFEHDEKARRLHEAIAQNPPGGRGQTDLVPPTIGARVRAVRTRYGKSMNDLEPAVPKATLSRFENGETPMKRQTFQQLASQLDDELLEAVAHSELYWDRIESVSSRDSERLYDLTTSSSNFVANGVIAHNTSDHRSLVEDAFRDRLIKCVSATPTLAAGVNTPSRRVVVRDWRRYSGDAGGMTPLSVLEIHQMMGRAGRPGMDPYGEAVLLANSHDELDELFERYVWAQPEPVRSKLAAEPAMRTHILATVASGFASSRDTLLEFLEETLYAAQTDEQGRLEQVMERMLGYLETNGFVEREADGGLKATGLGHTVSRLYLDPMSAAEIVDGLREASEAGRDPTAMGLYHLVCRTPDMYQLYLRSGDREELTMEAYEREEEFLGAMPSEFEDERFEDWLSALKTALLLEDWAEEVDEDRITEKYGVGPGDIRGKVDTAGWLLGAAESLAAELDLGSATAVRRAKKRVDDGVREELLDLAGVRGVGRKRARRLFEAGIETRADLREAEKSVVLGALRGRRKTAERILENAGHQYPSMEDVEADESAAPVVDERDGAEDEESEGQATFGDF